jgi:hypothetical protein
MRRAVLVPLLLAAGGCVLARPLVEPQPVTLMESALKAHEAGDVELAASRAAAAAADTSSTVWRTALLLQALSALDPRNPARSPKQGAAFAARYLETDPNDVNAAVARFLYTMALDLGAVPDTANGLPQLDRLAMANRLQELERAVVRLRAELARIQETLKP